MCPWKSLKSPWIFCSKKGYEPWRVLSWGCMGQCWREFGQSTTTTTCCFHIGYLSEPTWVHKFWVTHLHITSHSDNSVKYLKGLPYPTPPPPSTTHQSMLFHCSRCLYSQLWFGEGVKGLNCVFLFSPKCTLWKYLKNLFASDIVAPEKILLWNLIIPWSKDTNSVSIAYICQYNIWR